ncbi:enoyl-CoA hydratase-related protein [Enteractinococcus fodinae]|uniref:Enoyl-CoA hydratase/carnithine racemase n=1 Tax=Enteractinococcus fodinae TaxID=684663 RepID=A0ABU2AX55_9MICC|nr:enoyl-CoA hydratase/isomerase family protein [Enteractinococcus fodinae]MDR7345932.1 enoyl-CoA hydratase/carnithine racemase [Enteractinococcus fodinae]
MPKQQFDHQSTQQEVSTGTILVEIEDHIGHVIINNPKRKNAFNLQMCRQMVQAMYTLDNDPAVKVISIRGAEGNFSAGANLKDLDSVLFSGATAHDDGVDELSLADRAISSVRKPTFAFVEGICMGGGWQIAAAADVVVASSNTRIAITPSKLGIIYPRSGLERLKRQVGEKRANFLLMTADEVTVEQAENWNLVSTAVPADEFELRREEILQTVVARSQFSTVSMKRLMKQENEPEYEELWSEIWHDFRVGEDLAAGRAAFAKRQSPSFTWTLEQHR